MSFKIAAQPKKYSPEYGDITCVNDENVLHYVRRFDGAPGKELEGLLNSKYIARLGNFSFRYYNALLKLSFDKDQLTILKKWSTYTCPIMDQKYVGVLPIALLTDNIRKYAPNIDKWIAEIMEDRDSNLSPVGKLLNELDEIRQKTTSKSLDYIEWTTHNALQTQWVPLHMGPGYTECTMPNDGHADLKLAIMDIEESEDKILAYVMEWYNK